MEANVEAVMGAYNRTLDEPCCASKLLLEDILRGEWSFEGHVVSDCGALSDFHLNHKVTQGAAETVALALKHGCDIGCDHVYDEIPDAIAHALQAWHVRPARRGTVRIDWDGGGRLRDPSPVGLSRRC
jgi:beta-glucosidase